MNQKDAAHSTRDYPWLIGLGFLVLLLPGLRTISHSDFWMHLASGRVGFVRVDRLSQMSAGEGWINTHWLYDWFLSIVWAGGGAVGVTFLHLLAVGVAFYLFARMMRSQASDGAVAIALCVAGWLLAPQFMARPGIFSFIFAAAFLCVLSRWVFGWKVFAVLLPLQVLWTNMHVSFLWGPMIALLFALQAYFEQPAGEREIAPALPRLGLMVSLLLVTLINPYGVRLYGGIEVALAGAMSRDWISPVSTLFASRMAGGAVTVALILGAAGLLTCKQRLPLAITSIAVLSAFLAVRTLSSGIHWFALFSFPFLVISAQSIGDLVGRRGESAALSLWGGRGVAATVIGVSLISLVALASNGYYLSTGSFSTFGLGVNKAPTPYAALSILQHEEFPERWVNLPMDGGFLAYTLPQQQSYVDGRVELHGQAALDQLVAALTRQSDAWNQLLVEADPEAIVINNLWNQAAMAVRAISSQPDWSPLYFDGVTTILIRDISRYPELAEQRDAIWRAGQLVLEDSRQELRQQLGGFRRPPLSAAMLGAAPMFMMNNQFQQAAACYGMIRAQAPSMNLAGLRLGICHRNLGNHDAAVQELTRALDHISRESPEWLSAHLNLGISQLALGESAAAIRHFRVVNQMAPDQVWGWLYLGRAYEQTGQSIDARQAIERARSLNSELTEQFLRGAI